MSFNELEALQRMARENPWDPAIHNVIADYHQEQGNDDLDQFHKSVAKHLMTARGPNAGRLPSGKPLTQATPGGHTGSVAEFYQRLADPSHADQAVFNHDFLGKGTHHPDEHHGPKPVQSYDLDTGNGARINVYADGSVADTHAWNNPIVHHGERAQAYLQDAAHHHLHDPYSSDAPDLHRLVQDHGDAFEPLNLENDDHELFHDDEEDDH